MTKRYDEIDALKGFALFCVVLGHAIIKYPVNIHNIPLWKMLSKFIITFHMPLLFVVSGICFSYKGNYKEYILKKIKRLAIPYLFFNIVDALMRNALPGLVNNKRGVLESVYNIFFNGGEYWFLYVLFIIFLVYPFINKLNENRKVALTIEVVMFVLVLINVNVQTFCLNSVIENIFYFNTGAIFKKYILEVFDSKLNTALLLVSLILWILIFLTNLKLGSSVLGIVCSLCGITFSILLSKVKVFTNFFKRFGKYSLQLYCLNGYALVLSRTIICRLTNSSLIIVPFIVLIGYFVSYFLIKTIIPRSKLLKFLTGMVEYGK